MRHPVLSTEVQLPCDLTPEKKWTSVHGHLQAEDAYSTKGPEKRSLGRVYVGNDRPFGNCHVSKEKYLWAIRWSLNNNKSVVLNDRDGRRRARPRRHYFSAAVILLMLGITIALIAFLGWLLFRLSGLIGW